MAKRIFWNVVVTAVFAVLLTALLIVPAMYRVYEDRIGSELELEADYIVRALDMTEDDLAYIEGIAPDNRVTLIAGDGSVIYDSVAQADQMENHAQRPEVVQALEQGSGESIRNSDTLSETTIYYARRTASGDVLRIANTRSSVLGVFLNVMPLIGAMLLAVVVLSLLIARRAAKRIIVPINALNLDEPLENDAYDELAPLLTRMEQQHAQIHQQMQALGKARTELAAIMENMSEGMILLDTKDAVLSMNESAARIFGVNAENRIGHNLLAVNRDAALHELVQAAQRGVRGDMLMKRNANTYQCFASPVAHDQTIRGVVLLVLDVTERFAAETSRREFTANVSHELKTPLTSISGYAEIIRDGIAQSQDVASFAGKIYNESQRLITLVNDILELSRLDEKQGMGKMSSVALTPLLKGLADDFAPLARKKEVALTLKGDSAVVEGYATLLRELFYNLIDNSLKYTPAGGSVTVDVRREDGLVACSVSDTGIGIPAEHQPHVFERFYRVDKSHSRATGGTGLGLAIVKHVADIHHAAVELVSQEQQGTTITVRFQA